MAEAAPAKAAPANARAKGRAQADQKAPPRDPKKMLGMSAYEVIQEMQKAKPRASVSRIVYAASLAEGTSQEACVRAHGQIWAALKEEEKTSVYEGHPDMEATGLLLVHATAVVHVFETKCPNALEFLKRAKELSLIHI